MLTQMQSYVLGHSEGKWLRKWASVPLLSNPPVCEPRDKGCFSNAQTLCLHAASQKADKHPVLACTVTSEQPGLVECVPAYGREGNETSFKEKPFKPKFWESVIL